MDLRTISRLCLLLIIFSVPLTKAKEVAVLNNVSNFTNSTVHHYEMFKVVDWKFDSLKTYFIYTIFIIIVVLMKILYFHIPKLSLYIPESCILVVAGVIFGILVKFTVKQEVQYFKLTPRIFFSVLLPPIILEASYSLYHRNFLDNILSILVFAVFGTLLNFIIIGVSLFGLSRFGAMQNLNLDLLHCLLFSSLIVAVDPVAVLAIFHDVGVNADLYYLVFGESLLNDAVTVVLYEMMQEFATMKEIGATNIVLGFISFFTVSLGGMLIGILVGLLSCLVIRLMTNKNTLLLEPIFLMSMGYFAYLSGDVFGWSGIISTIACGLIQASYAFFSINDKSRLVLKRFVKILSAICEALIFLFLGVELVVGKLAWDSSFAFSSLFLCLITRFIVTFSLSGIINKIHMSLRSIPLKEKIIISYGGLRGAVAFSLAMLIKPEALPANGISEEVIITTTLFIILFTIIIQGITVKPIVSALQITKKAEMGRLSLLDELNDSMVEAATSGINSILGKCGRNYFFMCIEKFNDKYLRPILQGNVTNSYTKMLALNEKINQVIITGMSNQQSSHNLLKQLPNSYLNLMILASKPSAPPTPTLQVPKMQPSRLRIPTRHDNSMSPSEASLRPEPRLQNILIRASSIRAEQEDTFESRFPKVLKRLSDVNMAKNRFLKMRKNTREEQPMIRLSEIKDLDDTVEADDEQSDVEETFY